MLAGLLGAFGPFLAAAVTALVFDGTPAIRQLLARLLVWRVRIWWYLLVLLLPAAMSLAKTSLHVLLGGSAPDFAQPPFVRFYPLPPELAGSNPWIFLPVVFLQQTLLGSSMGEEPGWRGYALPRLQSRLNALTASLVLGLLWGLWHLRLYFTKGNPLAGTFFGWMLLGIVADAILFTWVYNNTRGSLLLVLLFHSSIAVTNLFVASAEAGPLVGLALSWGVVLVVVATNGAGRLSRGPRRGECSQDYLPESAPPEV